MPARRAATRSAYPTPANSTKNESLTSTPSPSTTKSFRRSSRKGLVTPSSLTDEDEGADEPMMDMVKDEEDCDDEKPTVTRSTSVKKRKGEPSVPPHRISFCMLHERTRQIICLQFHLIPIPYPPPHLTHPLRTESLVPPRELSLNQSWSQVTGRS